MDSNIEFTSGWNCCSVRVWQYLQLSPASQTVGSIHSSLCLTCGQGVDLQEKKQNHRYSFIHCGLTCIYISKDFDVDHADYDIVDKRNLVDRDVADVYMVQFYNSPKHNVNLRWLKTIRLFFSRSFIFLLPLHFGSSFNARSFSKLIHNRANLSNAKSLFCISRLSRIACRRSLAPCAYEQCSPFFKQCPLASVSCVHKPVL